MSIDKSLYYRGENIKKIHHMSQKERTIRCYTPVDSSYFTVKTTEHPFKASRFWSSQCLSKCLSNCRFHISGIHRLDLYVILIQIFVNAF